jgi:hypothetical protein
MVAKDALQKGVAMAIISMLCGSVLGMFSALTSLIFLDVSWVMALGIWSLSGAAMSLGLLAMAMMPQRAPGAGMARQTAGSPDFT